jgi:hypothetical protein
MPPPTRAPTAAPPPCMSPNTAAAAPVTPSCPDDDLFREPNPPDYACRVASAPKSRGIIFPSQQLRTSRGARLWRVSGCAPGCRRARPGCCSSRPACRCPRRHAGRPPWRRAFRPSSVSRRRMLGITGAGGRGLGPGCLQALDQALGLADRQALRGPPRGPPLACSFRRPAPAGRGHDPFRWLSALDQRLDLVASSSSRSRLLTAARERPTASAACWWVMSNSGSAVPGRAPPPAG